MNTQTDNNRRKLPYGVILTIVGVGLANIIGYFVFKTTVEIGMQAQAEKFKEYSEFTDKRFSAVYDFIADKTSDRIHGKTVMEMFKVRDVEIRAVANNVLDIKKEIIEMKKEVRDLNTNVLEEVKESKKITLDHNAEAERWKHKIIQIEEKMNKHK